MVADASLLAKLSGQKRVKSFLTRAVEGGRAAHAYLFVNRSAYLVGFVVFYLSAPHLKLG